MLDPSTMGLGVNVLLFIGAGAVIGVAGVLLTARAERLAEATGLGQAVLGAVFLGAATSLSGTVTSVSAALNDFPEIAFGNAVGGIAAQTAFLAIADMAYRKANLEHAAASEANLMQGVLLVVLLAIPLIGMSWNSIDVLGIDVISLVILAAYVAGVRLISRSHTVPMWQPRQTPETQSEKATQGKVRHGGSMGRLWVEFALLAGVVAVSGWVVARTGIAIATQTGLSQTLIGNVFTSVTTSLPELVVAIAAVRRGALTLAVGDILGGNSFDVLFLFLSDLAYRPGSLYQAVSGAQAGWLALTILMTGILLMGLLRRERHGPGNIGFESVLVLVLYAVGVAMVASGRAA